DIAVAESHHMMAIADKAIGELADGRIEIRACPFLIVIAGNDNPHRVQSSGRTCLRRPPMRTGSTRFARPEASVSTKTPHSVAGPSAGWNRPLGMRVVKRFSGSSLSMPMTEL